MSALTAFSCRVTFFKAFAVWILGQTNWKRYGVKPYDRDSPHSGTMSKYRIVGMLTNALSALRIKCSNIEQ